ncbi:MAG: FtsX-like permease family protein [Phycisphaerae bacterium]
MRRLWPLATRHWSASPGRIIASLASLALGVGAVVLMTGLHETARQMVTEEVIHHWFGRAQLSIHPPGGHWGSFDASITSKIARLPNVSHVTARLRRRARLIRAERADRTMHTESRPVDVIGVDQSTQQHFDVLPHVEGRTIRPGERGVAVIDRELRSLDNAELGDDIFLAPHRAGTPLRVKVVGVYTSEHPSGFQPPGVYMPIDDARALTQEDGTATAIEIMLADTSRHAVATTQAEVERLIAECDNPSQYVVESAAARQQLLDEADRIARLLLMLGAFVALLTSFFIILTTMSISLFERRSELGVMRCVGLTQAQLVALLFVELMPLGVAGTGMGLVLGMAAAKLIPQWADLAVDIRLSTWGLGLAASSGIITMLVSVTALILQVCRVTPLTAVHPQARPARRIYVFVSACVGVMLLLLHELLVRLPDQTRWLNTAFAGLGAASLYFGYVLIAPLVVVLIGPPLARLVGPLFGLRGKLVEDQCAKTPWRSAGICWVLMVGLSLIVYTGIGSEAVIAVWDFPNRLPDAFVWLGEYVPSDVAAGVAEIPGVGETTIIADVDCEIAMPDQAPRSDTHALVRKFLHMLTRPVFVACDPAVLLNTVKITLIEGSAADAISKLQAGGHVLIPVQTSRSKNLHLGDRVKITIQGHSGEFSVAGVIQSPAVDLTATAFRASSYMQFAAASVMLGTHRDLKEKFGLDIASLVLLDLNLPPARPPESFDPDDLPDPSDTRSVARAALRWGEYLPCQQDVLARIRPQIEAWLAAVSEATLPQDSAAEIHRFARAIRHVRLRQGSLSTQRAWEVLREKLVLFRMAQAMDRPDAMVGSLRRLKSLFDRTVRRALGVLTYLPSVAFTVAVIGVANLMMVSVQLRSRQIAVLRAVGALKSQVVCMVLAEAVVLGLLGSVMGVALGIHEAYSDNRISGELIGFYPEFVIPTGTVMIGVAVTVATCLAAGVPPARRAARNNIIAAMQTT